MVMRTFSSLSLVHLVKMLISSLRRPHLTLRDIRANCLGVIFRTVLHQQRHVWDRLILASDFAFSALTLLVGQQEGHPACKKIWGMVEVGAG